MRRKKRRGRPRKITTLNHEKSQWRPEEKVQKELENALNKTQQETAAIEELCQRLGLSKVIVIGEAWDRRNYKWNRGFTVLEEIGHFEFNRVQAVVMAGQMAKRTEEPK